VRGTRFDKIDTFEWLHRRRIESLLLSSNEGSHRDRRERTTHEQWRREDSVYSDGKSTNCLCSPPLSTSYRSASSSLNSFKTQRHSTRSKRSAHTWLNMLNEPLTGPKPSDPTRPRLGSGPKLVLFFFQTQQLKE